MYVIMFHDNNTSSPEYISILQSSFVSIRAGDVGLSAHMAFRFAFTSKASVLKENFISGDNAKNVISCYVSKAFRGQTFFYLAYVCERNAFLAQSSDSSKSNGPKRY